MIRPGHTGSERQHRGATIMTATSIRETVERAAGSIPAGYQSRVDAVVQAMEEREFGMTETATQIATSRGLSAREAEGVVNQIGLAVRPAPEPEPVAAVNDDRPIGERVDNLLTEMKNI